MNKHFCKLLLAAGHEKINRTRPFPWKIKNSAWGTDKDKLKPARNSHSNPVASQTYIQGTCSFVFQSTSLSKKARGQVACFLI